MGNLRLSYETFFNSEMPGGRSFFSACGSSEEERCLLFPSIAPAIFH